MTAGPLSESLTDLTGVGHIMVTPFRPDQSLDVESLRSAVDFVCESGASAIVTLGIMGEAHRLTDDERVEVIAVVVEQNAGRLAVIAGCTAESTYATTRRVEQASTLGCDAVMIAPPRTATTPALQLDHYRDVATAVHMPIVVQDEPVTTGVIMTAQSIASLCDLDRVAAVKVEQVPSPTKISQIRGERTDARCFGGLGGLYLLEELDRGAVGIMTGFAMPEILAQICRAYAAGDRDTARDLFFHYLPLIRYEAQLGVGGVAIRKQLMAERGIIKHPTVRGPVPTPDPLAVGELRRLLTELASP